MNSSDYILSMQALNFWLEHLEEHESCGNSTESDLKIRQLNKSFNNIFKDFSELYKAETGLEPPDSLRDLMVYEKTFKGSNSVEKTFKREVKLTHELASLIRELINEYDYVKLKSTFDQENRDTVYLNIDEAEALIELVIIEQKKALLKYPNYDKSLDCYNEEHENMILGVQCGLYEKVILSVTEVFKEIDKECLI